MRYHWVSSNVKQSGYDDMVLLKSINENEIFNNLKKRFLDNYIYTYIGPVLIAINPYKEMPYFTEAEVNQYRGATQTENPPHIYALADAMYRNMVNDSENQCVIISGESGAGKTVSAKYIMSYVSKVSGGGSSTRVQHIKDIILQSNPLLEAFGNAKTLRNNNSSRFGKYVEIQFGRGGEPVGGKITNFLLEKSRVVGQTRNERNFHIFYQLCCHTDETLKKNLGLQQMSRFQYLSKSGCYEVDGVNDIQEFKDVLKAMQVINVSPENQTNIFNIIAGILHLGNVSFAEEANYAVLSDERFLEFPSYLFGIRKDGLKTKLTSRIIETKWAAKAEKIESTFNVQQAEYTRDALSKALYSRLFDYLVDEINNAMQNKSTDLVNTGILDIYGFEIFDQNGFEQFCINYVNEKLQQIFIELTLKAEQEEYKQENIKWTEIPYFNNKVVCDLIESKNQPVGIFSLCDDVVATMHATGDGADDQLLQKLGKTYSGHAHFSHNNHGFLVKHYAGDVAYSIDGFCEKNRDSLFQDLIDLMKTSTNQFIQNLFPEQQTGTTNKRPTTAGSKIKTQANQLVDKLMKCYPHYIRCVKPNDNKQPREVNESTVKHQIKYLGLAENIRVRRAGFAYRREFGKFIQRFGIVTNETRNWKGPLDVGIRKIMDSVNMEMDQWQMGKTKVFIKAPESLFLLEEVRERKYNDYALVLQKAFRKFNAVKYYQKLKLEASNIVLNKKERRRLSINRKFYGDYIGLDSFPGIKALLNKRENIEFAQKCWKYDRQFKRTTRDIVLTNRAIHIIGREEQKQQKRKVIVEVLKRRIEFNQIDRIVLSKYIDNFVLIYPKNDYATVLEIEYKTEFLTTLHKRYKELLTTFVNIVFVDSVDFPVKKEGWGGGGTRTVKFMKDPRVKDTVIKTSGKVLTVASPEGLANTTRPTENYYTLYNFKNEPWWPKFEQLRQKYGITIKSSQNIAKNEVYTQYTRNTERQPQQQQQQQRQQYPQPQQLQQNQQKKQFPQQQQQQGLYENITKPPVAQRKPPPEPNLPKCRVLYDYHANDTDELTITTGQIIYIVAERDGGWWTGKLNGKEGLFPGNYVEKI